MWSKSAAIDVKESCFSLGSYFNSIQHSQKRTGHPSEPVSALGFFLGSCLSREFFLATVLLRLHYLLFGVLGWVSE